MLTVNPVNPPRCECHECTQARWKMSFAGQMQQQAFPPAWQQVFGLAGGQPAQAENAEVKEKG